MSKLDLSIEKKSILNKSLNLKIKVGDRVKIIAGNDRGKTSEVIKILKKTGYYGIVRGINMVKKVQRSQAGSSFVHIEKPIHLSNVIKINN